MKSIKIKSLKFSQNNNLISSVFVFLALAFLSASFITPPNSKEKYVFIVGVADYEGESIDLNYSDDDALLFYKKMRKLGVKKENMVILLDKNATQLNIIKKMSALFLNADENDQVIFFFSGHGGKGYFVPYDYDKLLSHKTIKQIFKQCKAKKKICFADACFSGSIRKKVKNKAIKVDDTYTLKQDINGGVAVIMSSKNNESSQERGELRQGVFTYYLLEGLNGNADLNSDKTITITELYKYTRTKVIYKSGGKQTPIIFGNFDINMPILQKK